MVEDGSRERARERNVKVDTLLEDNAKSHLFLLIFKRLVPVRTKMVIPEICFSRILPKFSRIKSFPLTTKSPMGCMCSSLHLLA